MNRVVKVGGRALRATGLTRSIAALWSRSARLLVVHGGGDEVTALQEVLGEAPTFAGGRRVTRAADIALLRMALSGAANKALVASLLDQGVPAVGISGEDGPLLVAERVPDERLGLVGEPTRVNVPLLNALEDAGFVPVISPVARQDSGGTLNVNADDAAAAFAQAIGADELLLVSDVPGVLVDGEPRAILGADEARELVGNGSARDGMAPKLTAALSALERGVAGVRIGDVAMLDDDAAGTLLRSTVLRRPPLALVT